MYVVCNTRAPCESRWTEGHVVWHGQSCGLLCNTILIRDLSRPREGEIWGCCQIAMALQVINQSVNLYAERQHKYNKLWCAAQQTPPPSIAASRGLPELTQNLIRSSHGHSTYLPWKFHANRSSRFLVMGRCDSIAASRGLLELTLNLISSSHGHFTPSLKISCKSVRPFSRNLADNETKKSLDYNTPSPYRGG